MYKKPIVADEQKCQRLFKIGRFIGQYHKAKGHFMHFFSYLDASFMLLI